MSKILNVNSGDYTVRVGSGQTITLDTGAGVGKVVMTGNMEVQGTQTTINSTAITLNDKNIVIADSSADSSALNGGGIIWGG